MSAANLFSSGSSAKAEAITEKGEATTRRIGRSALDRHRSTLFPGMDYTGALTKVVPMHVTADNRMSDVEAAEETKKLINKLNLQNESDAVMVTAVKAILLCMAINSSSVLVPGRAKFFIGESRFDFFEDVMVTLGDRARRYFRAYADVTRDILKDTIREFESGQQGDTEEAARRYELVTDMYNAIMFCAEKRGLTRVPYMIHDSAEYCTNKTRIESMYVDQSKATIFAPSGGYKGNPVDNPIVTRSAPSRHVGAVMSGGDSMPENF